MRISATGRSGRSRFVIVFGSEEELKALHALQLIYSDPDYEAMRALLDGFVKGLDRLKTERAKV